jgi:glycosyltransferase involved in cell wall biosynthesis
MKRPYVSAVINSYNYGRFVGEAIESALGQDFPADELEVVVVDDGSTDDTRERVAKYGERVRYLRKKHGGQASALNLGFAEARGEIVALLDADDVWLPEKIRRVAEAFEKNPDAGMVYHAAVIWETERNLCYADAHERAISGHVPRSTEDLLAYRGSGTSGLTFRKALAAKLLPIPEELALYADSYLMYLIIFLAPVVMLNEYLLKYRIHGGNNATLKDADQQRLRRRVESVSAAVREIEGWLRRQGYDLDRPEVAAYMQRHRLWERALRFQLEAPGRLEFFGSLREQRRLYGSYWPPQERWTNTAASLAALLIGYRGYQSLRDTYRKFTGALHFERALRGRARSWDAATPSAAAGRDAA